MSLIVLTNFIRIMDHGDAQTDVPDEDDLGVKTQGAYQNGFPNKVAKIFNPVNQEPDPNNYNWLGFVYQGAALTMTGDNLESTLVFANNKLTMNLVIEAVQKRWQIKVETWVMSTSEEPEPLRRLAMEKWIASSLSYDAETIEVTLSSAIDAIAAGVPQKVLTMDRVGDLPMTGNLRTG